MTDLKGKSVRDSQVQMTEMVLPNHTNRLGNLLGGQLMHWIDICAAIASFRHTNRVCVTASVDELNFLHPIKEGEVVILEGSVNRAFKTSVEVGVKVISENPLTGHRRHANTAYLTFVALDDSGKPTVVPPVLPQGDEEERRFEDAARRRSERLEHRKQHP